MNSSMYVYFCVYKVLYLLKKTLKKLNHKYLPFVRKKPKYISIYISRNQIIPSIFTSYDVKS